MAVQTRSVLKTYFETGDKPTSAQFGDLIDSALMANFTQVTDTGVINAVANTTYWCTISGTVYVTLNNIVVGESCVVNRFGSAVIANAVTNFTGSSKSPMYAAGYSDVFADTTGVMSYAVLIAAGIYPLINRAFYK